MGNAVTKVSQCCAAASGDISRRHDIAVYLGDPLHGGLGHSFCYVRPDPALLSNAKIHCEEETVTFRSISGASVSANASTPSSTTLIDASSHSSGLSRPSTFESSELFASIPLQPVPRGQFQSGSGALVSGGSGPMERGFLSGPIERGFLSGPIDRGLYSGPAEKEKAKQSQSKNLQRNFSDQLMKENDKPKKQGLIKTLKRAISNTISRGPKPEGIKESDSGTICENGTANLSQGSTNLSDEDQIRFSNGLDGGSELSSDSQNLQWAQGKAGEDRVHIVISEEQGWAFVGIYDGFNGPDAPDYLLSNLYANVHKELNGLLRSDKLGSQMEAEEAFLPSIDREKSSTSGNEDVDKQKKYKRKEGRKSKYQCNCGAKRWKESRGRWRCDWEIESQELDWKSNHSDVLKALSHALKKTEEDYMAIADDMATENPELALMGSCVLVMLMKGDDVYLMNVGDSRAVLAQKGGTNLATGTASQDLGIISEESLRDFDEFDGQELYRLHGLKSLQLTMDHSTFVDTEVRRIKKEHPDDVSAVINDRVKGYLKVTRAFGVGFLKQPKWNDLLLEMFRIDYIGTSPYIICIPSLYHYRLSPWDRFLILSSDGLYQYFTNEEAVFVVDSFLTAFPEGDPAQHLVEEVLFRAAKKAGMDFHELLDIPQGDRRRYHDDVSVIIISLEGRIWRSCV